MTDKEWNERLIFWLKIIIAIYLVAIVLFLTWNLSARLTNNQIHKQTQSQSYSNDARKYESEVCGRLSGAALGQCVAEVKNSTRQNKRDDDDLVAQQEMAEWAKAMTFVSLLSFGLAAFGIWYVRANLDEMKAGRAQTKEAVDAAKVANNISAQQFRWCGEPYARWGGQKYNYDHEINE